jgi:hypothetical protein
VSALLRLSDNGQVPDERLLGYWSDKNLYPGDMEAADVVFRADGVGWVYWYGAGMGFEVLRFTWQAESGHGLTVRLQEYASGTWDLDDGNVMHQVRGREARDEVIEMGYEVRDGDDAAGRPVTLLGFDQALVFGVTGDLFALERELAEGEVDPASESPA